MTFPSLALFVCGVVWLAQGSPATRPSTPAEPGVDTVPLELLAGRPVISVNVNGAGPFRLLIDPLAAVTRLDPRLIEELQLRRTEGANGQPEPPYRVDLQVATLSLAGVRAESVDMAGLVPGFSPATRPRGIIGGDAWRGRLLTIDFSAWRVSLAGGALPPPDGVAIFSLEAEDVGLGIPVVVAGDRLTATLDVLFAGGLVLPDVASLRPPLAKVPAVVKTLPTRAAPITVHEMQLAGDAGLLSVVLTRPAVLFSRQVRVPTLGTAWLGQFAVSFDAANRRVKLVPRPPS